MLLRHPWLAPLTKPSTITEEDEETAEDDTSSTAAAGSNAEALEEKMADPEVGQWVCDALARKKSGKMGKKAKPALHAAPLDAARAGTTPPATS